MRSLSLSVAAGVLGVIVLLWQIPLIGTESGTVWMSLLVLAIAVLLLAIAQLRHHGG